MTVICWRLEHYSTVQELILQGKQAKLPPHSCYDYLRNHTLVEIILLFMGVNREIPCLKKHLVEGWKIRVIKLNNKLPLRRANPSSYIY